MTEPQDDLPSDDERPEDEWSDEETDGGSDEHEDSLIDEMRGSGVGTEDPNIVGGDTHLVDEQVAKDEPPQV
jgi:hypothetical protein